MPAQPPPPARPRSAVFLDRDDTLIANAGVAPGGDLGDPALVELLPGVFDGCTLLRDAGFTLVVVSNQGGVARGLYEEADVHAVHERLNELLAGMIDAFRFCPFHPEGVVERYRREHPWRKPSPGMLLDAAECMNLDPARSWMIGDALRDCEAGRAAGCRTVLVRGPSFATPPIDADAGRDHPAVDAFADDFLDAAGFVIAHSPTAGETP
jgi:D-glycero-D-manno-heptose 1,7-bisphosphate phosphatase